MAKGLKEVKMKKKSLFILILCLSILVLSVVLFAGCADNELTSPRDLNIVDGNFVWTEVEGADGYMLYFNESESERFFTWYNHVAVGDENIKSYLISGQKNMLWIRAVKLDEYGFPAVESDRSRLDFEYIRKLDTPTRLSADNNTSTLSWRAVDGADEYYAVVDGKEYKINYNTTDMGTTGTLKSLPNGDYQLSIIAKGTGYKDSNPTDTVRFTQTLFEAGGNDEPADGDWTVTFDLNYDGSTPFTKTASDNRAVDKPEEPVRIGYTFVGWYFDSYCMVEAGFTSSRSKFNITANTTLYAKWKAEQITTTPVYFYNADWTVAYAQIYNGENPLFSGKGILLNKMDGKKNWYRANIDERTTRIVFTNGEDLSEEITDFNMLTPYYRNGGWTATMPEDIVETPDIGQYITVNGVKYNLVENIDTDTSDGRTHEYMITINLEIGDVIELKTKDGHKYVNYEPECNFKGVVNVNGEYSFYVKIYPDGDAIWVEVPENDNPVGDGITFYYFNINRWKSVYAYVWNDNGNGGAWPGTPMKAVEGHDNWYTITVSEDMVNIIFNGGSGSGQTADLVIDVNNTYHNGFSWTNDFIEHTGATTRTVYFYNDKGWVGVRAYAWSGGSEMAWPGLTMTEVEGKNGWYSVEISIELANILFNSLSDSETKTVDLKLPAGTDDVYYNGGWVDSMN